MIRWYLQHDLTITTVHQLVEHEQGPFSMVSRGSYKCIRKTDIYPLKKKQLLDVTKLKGSSFYGKIIENLGHRKRTKFTLDEWVVEKTLKFKFLDDL